MWKSWKFWTSQQCGGLQNCTDSGPGERSHRVGNGGGGWYLFSKQHQQQSSSCCRPSRTCFYVLRVLLGRHTHTTSKFISSYPTTTYITISTTTFGIKCLSSLCSAEFDWNCAIFSHFLVVEWLGRRERPCCRAISNCTTTRQPQRRLTSWCYAATRIPINQLPSSIVDQVFIRFISFTMRFTPTNTRPTIDRISDDALTTLTASVRYLLQTRLSFLHLLKGKHISGLFLFLPKTTTHQKILYFRYVGARLCWTLSRVCCRDRLRLFFSCFERKNTKLFFCVWLLFLL